MSKGVEEGASKAGFKIVVNEGYSATAPDLSSLVTKLKREGPDVVFHTGYNPDITLFLRQAREMGLRFSAVIGHGAGYGVYDKLKEGLGNDVNYFFNVDPISIWLTSEKALKQGLPEIIKVVGEEYTKARPGTVIKSAHVGMAASNTYVLLTEVLPRAIKKYGGFDEGRARSGPARRRYDAWFRREVRQRRVDCLRSERTRISGHRPVYRRQVVRGVAEEPAGARAGLAAAPLIPLCEMMIRLFRSRLDRQFLIQPNYSLTNWSNSQPTSAFGTKGTLRHAHQCPLSGVKRCLNVR